MRALSKETSDLWRKKTNIAAEWRRLLTPVIEGERNCHGQQRRAQASPPVDCISDVGCDGIDFAVSSSAFCSFYFSMKCRAVSVV
jgi:hypothetical protein